MCQSRPRRALNHNQTQGLQGPPAERAHTHARICIKIKSNLMQTAGRRILKAYRGSGAELTGPPQEEDVLLRGIPARLG